MRRCSSLLLLALSLALVMLYLPPTVSSHVATGEGLLASGAVNVRDFGAKGDVIMRTGSGSVTAGSNAFTDVTNGKFASDDVGKIIIIDGAGTAPHATWFRTTIASVQSKTVVTLTDTAGTTVTNAGYRYGSDDTTAFNNAVNAAMNGTLVIPPGNYGWTGRIDLGSMVEPAAGVTESITVNGAGMDQSILTFMGVYPDWRGHISGDPRDDKTQCFVNRWGTLSPLTKHLDGVTLRDFAIWYPPCTTMYTDYARGIGIRYADHLLIERCKVTGGDGEGILGAYGDYITIKDCRVEDNWDVALSVADGSHVVMTGNYVWKNWHVGQTGDSVAWYSNNPAWNISDCLIDNNYIEGNHSNGINLGSPDVAAGTQSDVTVSNNTVIRGLNGIYCGASNAVVEGNTVTDCGSAIGVSALSHVLAVSNVVVRDNTVNISSWPKDNLGTDNIVGIGVGGHSPTQHAVSDVVVSGNTVNNGWRSGICVNACGTSADFDNISILGNVVKNSSQNPGSWDSAIEFRTQDGGTVANCVVSGNHCYDDQPAKTQRYGLDINGTGVTNLVVADNDFRDNVNADVGAPITSDNADASWHRSAVTVTLAPFAPRAGGVASTHYQIDSGPESSGTLPTVAAPSDHSNDGIHTVRYWSTDLLGNVEATKSCQVRIDTREPVTSAAYSPSARADNAWYTGPVTVTFSAADPKPPVLATVLPESSGIDYTEYRVGISGDWARGDSVTIPAPPQTKATTTVFFRAVDKSGNCEAVQSCDVRIDTTGPAPADTTAAVTTVHGVDGDWHSVPVGVTFTAEDPAPNASGVAYTEYKLSQGGWTSGTSLTVPAPPDTKTIHTILYRSKDNAGNLEATKTCQVKIDTTTATPAPGDTTPPVTTTLGIDATWHDVPVTLTFDAEDPGPDASGVAYTECRLDGGAWTQGTGLTVPAPAATRVTHTILYRSADKAGNLEAAKSCTVKVDTTGGPPPPPPPVTTVSGFDDAWHRNAVTVNFTAVPAVGGLAVASTEYRLIGDWTKGSAVTVPAPSDHTGDGVHAISYRSADVGVPATIEDEQSCVVKIDTTRPSTSILAKARAKRGKTVALRYRVDDALPGGISLSPTAAVRITVLSSHGRRVKRIHLGQQATNTPLTYAWKCRLRKGSYRLRVYATDLAGNTQAKVVSARLTVK